MFLNRFSSSPLQQTFQLLQLYKKVVLHVNTTQGLANCLLFVVLLFMSAIRLNISAEAWCNTQMESGVWWLLPKLFRHGYKWQMLVLQMYLKTNIILQADTIPNGADCLDGEKGNFLKAFSCSWIFFFFLIWNKHPKLNNHHEKERYHTHNKKGPNPKRKGDKIR